MKRLSFNRGQALLQAIDHSDRSRNIVSGISPADVPIFIVAHLAGAPAGISVLRSFREHLAAPE